MLFDIIITGVFCIAVAYAYIPIKKTTDQNIFSFSHAPALRDAGASLTLRSHAGAWEREMSFVGRDGAIA